MRLFLACILQIVNEHNRNDSGEAFLCMTLLFGENLAKYLRFIQRSG